MLKSNIFALWVILISTSSAFSFAQAQPTSPQSQLGKPEDYPVTLGDQVLFYVRSDLGKYKGSAPEERAKEYRKK